MGGDYAKAKGKRKKAKKEEREHRVGGEYAKAKGKRKKAKKEEREHRVAGGRRDRCFCGAGATSGVQNKRRIDGEYGGGRSDSEGRAGLDRRNVGMGQSRRGKWEVWAYH